MNKRTKCNMNAHSYTLYNDDEDAIKELLLWHKIVGIDNSNNTLLLDNGVELQFIGNEGCGGCCSGWYEITELNGCDNAITSVEFECEGDAEEEYSDLSYKIFVFAEDKKIKIMQADGTDGNGYYGTGYSIRVKVPR